MPELPEVETVVRGIRPALDGRRLTRVLARRPDLRFPLPADFVEALEGQRVIRVHRRAKYIVITTETGPALLLHLGMSGCIRVTDTSATPEPGRHDHLIFETDGGQTLTFHDPRRFGVADFADPRDPDSHRLLAGLGPEPLSNNWSAQQFSAAIRGRTSSIKAALLDQRLVAGIGNIYAAEALYRARISPRRKAKSVAGKRAERLVRAVRDVLTEAIEAGGSSISDHARVDGELGYFQHRFRVYDREGEACLAAQCPGVIRRLVQSGRSTFFCPNCQR